jgi:hypothetical protein
MENRPTREAALARMAEIEKELTKLESESFTSEQDDQRRIAMATAAARAGGGGFTGPPLQDPETGRDLATGAVRYGIPLGVSLASGGLGIPAMMAVGAGSSLIGEVGAQGMEKQFEGKEYRPKEMIGATIRGAAPVFNKVPIALLKTAGSAAAAGGLGGLAEDKNPLKEGAYQGLAVGALGTIGKAAGGMSDFLQGGIDRSGLVEYMGSRLPNVGPGVEATVGQAFPIFAGLESRVVSQTGSQDLRQQLLDQSQAIARAVQGVMGAPAENYPNLVNRISSTIGNLGPETGARLANEAQNVNSAFAAVENARSAAQKSIAQDALAEAQQSFQKAVEMETLKGGMRTGAVAPYQAVAAGTRIEEIGKKAKEVIQTEARRLYGPANAVEDVPAFDLFAGVGDKMSFADRANDILNKIPGISTSTLTDVRKILGRKRTVAAPYSADPTAPLTVSTPQLATFKEIQEIRNELYDFADFSGEAIGSKAQAEIRRLAGSLSDTVTDQAPRTLGQEVANSINAGEEFYGATRPKLDVFGVKRAFIPQTMERGQMGQAAVGGVRAQGVQAPEFANLENLLSTLQKRGVGGAPSMQPVIDDLRSGIIDQAIDKATGQLDLMKLAGDLNNISQQGGNGLQKLGFGTKSELNRFVQYMQNLDPATAKGPEAVLNLLKTGTPAGFSVASRAVKTLPDLATVDSVMRTLEKQAINGSKAAGETLTQIRAREIEDLLLKASSEGRVANLGSLTELSDPAMRANVELIIGKNLMKQIDSTFIPGFRVIEEARQAAGMAGSTVRGAALERVGKSVAQGPVQIASGDVKQGVQNMLGNAAAALGYNVIAKVFAKGAGVTGLRKRQDFTNFLQKIAEKPAPQQIELLRRYAGEDSFE